MGVKKTGGKDKLKGKDESKHEGNAFPRGFMPWNSVLKKVAAKSFVDIKTLKQITDVVKAVAEEEIEQGRAFHFRGLGSFKLVTGPRVEASAAQGRAFDAVAVLGPAKLDKLGGRDRLRWRAAGQPASMVPTSQCGTTRGLRW